MNSVMNELSPEDALRLNVMLANELHAVRIDESHMTVHGLSPQGETAIRLNPTCRDETYVKIVRELLSGQVLGSPGGYPIFLKRWTRMGQARADNLEKLLLLGEPEAVVAVVHAEGLTHEIARRAWWIMPSSDNARKMLARKCVAEGELGPVLAEFLVEFLPFEENHQSIIESVRLILQPGLIDEETQAQLWKRARNKNTYYVGFLHALPDQLPDPQSSHALLDSHQQTLTSLAEEGNLIAALLLKLLQTEGQTFLNTVAKVLKKPNNQDVVVELLECIKNYFATVSVPGERLRDINQVIEQADLRVKSELPGDEHSDAISKLLEQHPELTSQLKAICALSAVGERLIAPVFATTDAIGSVMRKKIAHISNPIFEQLQQLHPGAK